MDCRYTLVRTYLFVCRRYRQRVRAAPERLSSNPDPDFTEEEVLTFYLFGIIEKCRTVREVHRLALRGVVSQLALLPKLQSPCRNFCVNRLSAVFAPLMNAALSGVGCEKTRSEAVRIADSMPIMSMPIMIASGKRSSQAKVTSGQLANKGYCSRKTLIFTA